MRISTFVACPSYLFRETDSFSGFMKCNTGSEGHRFDVGAAHGSEGNGGSHQGSSRELVMYVMLGF